MGKTCGAIASKGSETLKTVIFVRVSKIYVRIVFFYDVFLRVSVTKYAKIHAYLRRAQIQQMRVATCHRLKEIAKTPPVRHCLMDFCMHVACASPKLSARYAGHPK